uniref:Putative polyprotein n=1 Tax=Albugo laibachii Nc14 TaxID=890382 RepID=F0WXG4_9STRA|nr:putative polyprotein [Albugo laibachii Nc14]|eukprot:CCA26157.1 putative polyprotein [Albugo laibachii Nc14]
MGPMKTTSAGGSRYTLTFIDDYSRLVKVYFLRTKSQVFDYFLEYKAMMERQANRRIKRIRTDNDTECLNRRFAEERRRNGIIHQTSAPFSPQQNGLAERMKRTLMERARALMEHKNLEKEWWAEAINTAAYIVNRITDSLRPYTTPMEICFKAKPDLSHVRVFGSTGFAHIDKSKRSKLDAEAYPCLFLDYAVD